MAQNGKSKVLFIINPISGVGRQKVVEKHIPKVLDEERFEIDIAYTEGRNHARELSREAAEKSYDFVMIVGGDGSVSEAASGLIGTETIMGIIPAGSGNGLARGLQIPMQIKKAIRLLNRHKLVKIDTGEVNGTPFVNAAGVGFDAHIAKHFYRLKTRGKLAYAKLSLQEFIRYKARKYKLTFNGETVEREAFIIAFANSPQYGIDAVLAPNAIVNDKLLEVVFVKPFPIYMFPVMIARLFKGTIDKSRYVSISRADHIELHLEKHGTVHLDGDPYKLGKELEIKVVPQSLNVMVPPKNK